ncbi:MAG: O-methyltransferase [Actinomycetota bacterium]|nr:O-methyltransferase [Actinomycetota bacterium]
MADAMLNQASLSYAESFLPEDDVITAARHRAAELGCVPIGPGGGATLRLLAAATSARNVVEIGTGAGVSGLYLMDGMAEGGQFISIDIEGEHQRAAKEAFAEADIAPTRYRLINGSAPDVLPRMRDETYDLVFVDADKTAYGVYFEHALRMLRPGGVMAFDNALWHDRVADPTQRDADTAAVRDVGKVVRADARLIPAMLPVSDGLLAAAKR